MVELQKLNGFHVSSEDFFLFVRKDHFPLPIVNFLFLGGDVILPLAPSYKWCLYITTRLLHVCLCLFMLFMFIPGSSYASVIH